VFVGRFDEALSLIDSQVRGDDFLGGAVQGSLVFSSSVVLGNSLAVVGIGYRWYNKRPVGLCSVIRFVHCE